MTLDLKHPGALIIMERLCKWADVLAENFRPGILEKLGLGYEVVRRWNPKLIYASNSGFGAKGEWATRPSYDGMSQAFTGALHANGGGPSHKPRELPWVFSDVAGANNFYASILAALVARARTGEGQHVITSQASATLFFQQHAVSECLNVRNGKPDDSGKTEWEKVFWQQVHRTSDGRWVVFSFIQKRQLERLCVKAIQRPDLLRESIVEMWPGIRPDDFAWMHGEIAAEVAKHSLDHWLRVLVAADVPCSPVSTYAELADEQHTVGRHLHENGFMMKVPHRDFGSLHLVCPPTAFCGTPIQPPSGRESWHAPHIGEHNSQILRELGYSDAEATEFVRSGAVPAPSGPWEQEARKEKLAKFLKGQEELKARL